MHFCVIYSAVNTWGLGGGPKHPSKNYFSHFVGKYDALLEILYPPECILKYSDKTCFLSKVICYRLFAMLINVDVARTTALHTSLNDFRQSFK